MITAKIQKQIATLLAKKDDKPTILKDIAADLGESDLSKVRYYLEEMSSYVDEVKVNDHGTAKGWILENRGRKALYEDSFQEPEGRI